MLTNETLKEVIISQRKFLDISDFGIDREEIKDLLIHDSFALLITGVRRCGKSTFLHQLVREQKSYYLNLEDPRLEGFELSDFSKVATIMQDLYGHGGTYFFDEIQSVDKWEKFVRYLVDQKEKVVITGSNASLLSKELGTKLTGRHLRIEMFPFSFREFLSMKKKTSSVHSFDEFMKMGGFPEYVKQENPLILQELLSDVVLKDIAVRFGIKNTVILNKIILYLVSNVGKEFSHNAIKKMLGIKSVQSVIDYVTYFESAYLLFTIPVLSSSYKKQQNNPKKVYSIDNGLSYANSTSFSKDRGRMLENIVFLALRRKCKQIFYHKGSHECDFVTKQGERITAAMQVCLEFNDETKERELQGLLEAARQAKLSEGIILTYNQEDEFRIESIKVTVKPVWKWLLE